jgi:hypothetical protein
VAALIWAGSIRGDGAADIFLGNRCGHNHRDALHS